MATAGHVDHGKSTLVLALTGTDPDRLAEEKRRGLTIDLGFARLPLDGEDQIDLVDVPGHVRFLKTMLAGAGGVAGTLLAVAATEGWKPQTEEHLAILGLLGVIGGVVAVTMTDRVDPSRLAQVRADVASRIEPSALRGAEIVEVDGVSGRGVDALRAALGRWASSQPPASDAGRPRLWVDRAFARPGAGTVVTGTLTGGTLRVGEPMIGVAPRTVHQTRVRGLQSFGSSAPALGPGRRVAVNLSAIGHRTLRRGDALVQPDRWHLTSRIDTTCSVLTTSPRPVRNDTTLIAYLGSGEMEVRIRLLDGARRLEPGATGLARLELPRAVPLVPGDRFVLRDPARQTTLGGGEVLDVDPVLPPARARPDRSIERIVHERGWVDVAELERLTGVPATPTHGHWMVDPGTASQLAADLRARVDRAGPQGVELAHLDAIQRAVLAVDGALRVDGGRVRSSALHDPIASHPFLAALEGSPFEPPDPADHGVDPATLAQMVHRGLVVRTDGVVFLPAAIEAAAAQVAAMLAVTPEGVTVSQVRQALGTTRRCALPLLAELDRSGRTRRRGDLRIAGPRLPSSGDGSQVPAPDL
jgi:selenocysteine-specific elongation factor